MEGGVFFFFQFSFWFEFGNIVWGKSNLENIREKGSQALVLEDNREKEEEPREREKAGRVFSEPRTPGNL